MLTEKHRRVLSALEELTQPHGEWCVPYAIIASHAGMDFSETRRIVRHFHRKGLAEYIRGLMDEWSGMMCGSGHCITPAGRKALEESK